MKQVVLTIGPQGTGKSTFCHQVIKSHPEILMVSRDAILVEMFGSAYLDSYSGGHWAALEKMWEIVKTYMSRAEVLMILDCWNCIPEERREITKNLKTLGVDRIGAWYFVTPEDVCLRWYMGRTQSELKKAGPQWKNFREEGMRDSFLRHYEWFHSERVDCSQGFDFIIKLNPLEPPSFDALFKLKTSKVQNVSQ